MKNNDSDFLINESLNEYKNVIDARKTNDLSLSNYRVEKPWGHEVWLELNKFYAYKLISMKQGYKSSL